MTLSLKRSHVVKPGASNEMGAYIFGGQFVNVSNNGVDKKYPTYAMHWITLEW